MGRTVGDRNRHSQRCRFAAFGEASWSGLISAQIAVETPLQLERASATASAKAPSGQGAFKLPNALARGQKRRNDIALLEQLNFSRRQLKK